MKNLLLLTAFLTIAFTSHAQDEKKGEMKYDNWFKPNDKMHWKNPAAAFLLSMAIPGTGQMYNDQTYLGLGIFGAEEVFFGTGAALLKINVDDSDRQDRMRKASYAMFGIGGAIYLMQFMQAPIAAHMKNKSNKYVIGGAREMSYNIGLIPSKTDGIALGIQF